MHWKLTVVLLPVESGMRTTKHLRGRFVGGLAAAVSVLSWSRPLMSIFAVGGLGDQALQL